LQLTINNTFNATIGESPFFALFGFDSPTVTFTPPKLDYSESDLAIRLQRINNVRQECRDRLLKIQAEYTARTNKNRKGKEIHVNDRVYAKLDKHVHSQKLDMPIAGPFVVTAKQGNRLTIESPLTKEKYEIHPDSIITGQHMNNLDTEGAGNGNGTNNQPSEVITTPEEHQEINAKRYNLRQRN
jgi:hypothetical protein